MADWVAGLRREARARARAGLTRNLRVRDATDSVIDLAGNDYLGLSRHPSVVAAARQALDRYGLGATGSRLVRGTTTEHAALEHDLADLLGWPAALAYSSGYLANLGAVRALAPPGATIVSDAHVHASLIDGCRSARAATVVVPHASVSAVEAALRQAGGPALVVTESVFSVDGDLAPLAELHQACLAHDAVLLVDDAHGLGVLGRHGAGGVAAAGLAGASNLVVTATLSKAVGASGGVLAGPEPLIRHLIDAGRTFIFDTALPPAVAAGARAGLAVLRDADDARAELAARARQAVEALSSAGLEVSRPDAGVVSVTAPGPEEAVAWAAACAAAGVAVGCFRPPSTPDSRSRLRLTINTGVRREDFDHALAVIAKAAP
ncbi:MAG: 8-amino-7-oxononanoate synthase [Micromonosporaceae bacterium]